ncbi:MAG: AMIN domain-containing protein, partial [Thermoanaerobaculia bacterium]|nr:AMIN domain-containing protein [Thermoanaerobaculia bacterium]
AMEPEEALVAPAPVAAPDARELRAVEVHSDGSGTTVHLVADGRIAGAESFELADPARLVIDVPGVGSVASPRVEGSGAHVGSVRVGQHPDKVRVVVDGAADGSLEGWAATPVADGLVVTWGTASPPAEAAWSAPAAADEDWSVEATPGAVVAPPDAGTQVHDVAFHSGAGSSRVVIVTAGPASYQLFEPDGETVVVSMPDAALMPGADSRIAPDPGGPVALVMAFQQPEVERPEVRVVITRAPELTPMVTREGANLVVSFDSDDGTAATPPVLGADAGSTAAAKALASATDPSLPAAPAVTGDGLDILAEGGMVAGKQYVGRRMSLDFKDVELDDVLRLIGDVSDLNIIAGDDVKGTVTLRLVDVPWDQALDVILLTHGLGFEKVGNVLRIAPQALLQKESEARLQERRAKEKLEDLLVKFQPVNYAAVKNVAKMVQRLLSARGTVNTDERTNTVIIKDIPSVIDESVALIKAIDTPTPQVLIEAKVVEANLDFTRALGTVWGV